MRFGFSFLCLFTYVVSHLFVQAPAYRTNSTVSSSSIELRHFLSSVICEGMLDYKRAVVVRRGG